MRKGTCNVSIELRIPEDQREFIGEALRLLTDSRKVDWKRVQKHPPNQLTADDVFTIYPENSDKSVQLAIDLLRDVAIAEPENAKYLGQLDTFVTGRGICILTGNKDESDTALLKPLARIVQQIQNRFDVPPVLMQWTLESYDTLPQDTYGGGAMFITPGGEPKELDTDEWLKWEMNEWAIARSNELATARSRQQRKAAPGAEPGADPM